MTLKQQLELLNKEFTTLKTKLTAKLQTQQQTITDTNQKLNESNRKLETSLKENTENEKVLEKLIKEFKDMVIRQLSNCIRNPADIENLYVIKWQIGDGPTTEEKAKESGNSKFAGDAGYWQDEDAEVLANFFNSIANITDDINNIKLSANEQIFNNNKQQLIAKIQGLIGKYNFSVKLQRNLTAIEKLEPKHQKELLDLEKEAREAESAYKENLQKADNETDPDKKAEFIVLANKAAKKAEEIKRKVKNNPIAQLANFNYLDDLRALTQGNVPPNVCPDGQPGG
ncbi:10189_t:CDS:2, partial [Scutellospora calospora]